MERKTPNSNDYAKGNGLPRLIDSEKDEYITKKCEQPSLIDYVKKRIKSLRKEMRNIRN